jgi:hypothetical protein
MASAIFGLPLSTLACGLICLWAVRATRRHLESEIERKE